MLQEIQKLDYDRYISLIFAPRDKREQMMAVILYNIELARIRARVSELMAGHIRLAWWKEALDEIYDPDKAVRKHEVALKLKRLVVANNAIRKDILLDMVDARAKDLEEWPFETMEDMRAYLIATSYTVNRLFMDILQKHSSAAADEAVKEISYAWAMGAILRSAQRNLGGGRSVFPTDMMRKHGLSLDDYGKPKFLELSQKIVKELVDSAEASLVNAEKLLKDVPSDEKKILKPVLLQATLAKHNIKQIKKNDYDVLSKGINPYLGMVSLMKIHFS